MKSQGGFMLVIAIFVLVILGLLGSYMVRLSNTQHARSSSAIQVARAYQAAKAGLDWGIASIRYGNTCTTVNTQTGLLFPSIKGFSVALTCHQNSYSEGDNMITIYRLNAKSAYGVYYSEDYVARELEISVNLGT